MNHNYIPILRAKLEKDFKVNLDTKCRKTEYVKAREYYYKWLRENTEMTFKQLTKSLPTLKPDRASMLNALQKFDNHFATEKEYRAYWKELCHQMIYPPIDEENLVINAS